MTFSFLFSHQVIKEAFAAFRTTDFAISSKKVINDVADIFAESDDCEIYGTSQSLDQVSSTLIDGHQTKFKSFFCREQTTQGVTGFDATSALPESAKTLALNGPCIVVVEEGNKSSITPQARVRVMTPAELISIIEKYKKVKSLYAKHNPLDLFYLLVFESP